MWIDPPSGSNPPMYEYSADLSGDYPGGLAMLTAGSSCRTDYSPAEASVSTGPQVVRARVGEQEFDEAFHLSGRASVSIYTTTLGGLSGRGLLCAIPARSALSPAVWPTTRRSHRPPLTCPAGRPSTRRLSFTFTVSPQVDIDLGNRLVLVLHFREESANDIAVLYDHPDYPSLLEVETTTPIRRQGPTDAVLASRPGTWRRPAGGARRAHVGGRPRDRGGPLRHRVEQPVLPRQERQACRTGCERWAPNGPLPDQPDAAGRGRVRAQEHHHGRAFQRRGHERLVRGAGRGPRRRRRLQRSRVRRGARDGIQHGSPDRPAYGRLDRQRKRRAAARDDHDERRARAPRSSRLDTPPRCGTPST